MAWAKVSIITVNWNGLEDTIECLESFKKITYPNYEVVVVDNDSKGNDVQVLGERYGDYIHLVKNDKNYGAGGGNNAGIRYALTNSNSDYVLLLNNDVVVDPEFLTEMVEVAETDPAIAIAGAKIYCYHEPNRVQYVWGKLALWRGQVITTPRVITELLEGKEIDRGQYDSIKEVDALLFFCVLIKRSAIEKIGLFDEGQFFAWEDTDYCIRAARAGYKIVYVPKAKVWHKGGGWSVSSPDLRNYYSVRGNFRLMKLHATRWQYYSFLIYFFGVHLWLATAYCLIWLRQPRALISFFKGVRDGLANVTT